MFLIMWVLTSSCQPTAWGDAANTPCSSGCRLSPEHVAWKNAFNPPKPPRGSTVILIVHMRKLRHREAQCLVQDHTVVETGVKSWRSDSTARALNTRPVASYVRHTVQKALWNSESCII